MARRRLARIGVAALTLVAVAGSAQPALAVDPIIGTPLPPEPVARPFPDRPVHEALAVDLDDDGVREVVAVIGQSGSQGLAAVQAWWIGPEGVAAESNEVRVRRSASVDELLLGRGRLGIDRDDMIAVRMNEPAQLVVAQRDRRPVVLVATIGTDIDAAVDVPCCLTIWELVVEEHVLDLRLVADTQRYAAELLPADMDADGTDELLVTEGPINDENSDVLEASLLRWTGDRFARTAFTIPFVASCCALLMDAADTDGLPGEEALLTAPGVNLPSGLRRVSLRDGAVHLEHGDAGDISLARAVHIESGPAILTADGFSTLSLWEWPADGQLTRMTFRTTGGSPAAIFGTGADARLIAAAGMPPGSAVVLPADLGVIGAGPIQVFGRDTRAGSFSAAFSFEADAPPMDPFSGVFPGGLPGIPDAFVFAGNLLRPVSDPDVLAEVQPIALLPGLEPVGTTGPGNRWTALLSGFGGFFFPYPGGQGSEIADLTFARPLGTLRLVATDSVLEPEVDAGDLAPTFHGVARDPERPAVLIVGNDAVDAEVHGPVGTTVWWSTREGSGSRTIGPDGATSIRLLEPADPTAKDGSGSNVDIRLVTPAGHAYSGSWRIRVYRQPPDLGIRDQGALVDFSPVLSGQTLAGSTLTVNGRPVDVAADGSFAVPIDVGFLPTELRVVVVDPVGNRTERVVTRVWPIDYRQLPFIPIAVVLTIAAAALLFLRRPDTGPSRRTPDDGATFEEIGG